LIVADCTIISWQKAGGPIHNPIAEGEIVAGCSN